MHGSYNWIPTANYNKETLATALDHELVSKFAKEFMELYNGLYIPGGTLVKSTLL